MKLKQLIPLVILFVAVGLWTARAQTPPAQTPPAQTPLAQTPPAPTAPATQPDASNASAPSQIEVRAMQEFGRGNWASALPLLKKVQADLKAQNQVDRVAAIEENIRVCQRNLAAATNAQASVTPGAAAGADPAAAAQQNGPPTAENRKPHAPPKAGEVREMSIKDLGNFEYDADKGGNVPDDVKALSGSGIRLSGFMIPMDQADNITQFALVPSLFSCCFGQPPQIQHTIVVHVPKGKAVSYYPEEIVVEGKLTVDEKKEDGFIVSLFEMECSSVKPSVK